jgi:hypothetical protein
MINVKLKIIGDPDFIKQDDVYTNPGMLNYSNKDVLANGSIAMDHSEIFCQITFLTPVDVDESTGLMAYDTKYKSNKFSGLYKILTVSNEFSKGQFVQTLECIKVFDKNKTASAKSEAKKLGRPKHPSSSITPVIKDNTATKDATAKLTVTNTVTNNASTLDKLTKQSGDPIAEKTTQQLEAEANKRLHDEIQAQRKLLKNKQ